MYEINPVSTSQHYCQLCRQGMERHLQSGLCSDLFEEIEQEFYDGDIIILLPHQAAMLPKKCIDLFINISSLHEMQMQQIKEYFNLIDKLTKGYFYSKQWIVSENPIDKIVIVKNDYPVPKNWQELYSHQAKVQVHFFEAMYRITSNGMT